MVTPQELLTALKGEAACLAHMKSIDDWAKKAKKAVEKDLEFHRNTMHVFMVSVREGAGENSFALDHPDRDGHFELAIELARATQTRDDEKLLETLGVTPQSHPKLFKVEPKPQWKSIMALIKWGKEAGGKITACVKETGEDIPEDILVKKRPEIRYTVKSKFVKGDIAAPTKEEAEATTKALFG